MTKEKEILPDLVGISRGTQNDNKRRARMTGKPGPLFVLALTAVLFSLLPVLAA